MCDARLSKPILFSKKMSNRYNIILKFIENYMVYLSNKSMLNVPGDELREKYLQRFMSTFIS